jgi:Ala-tRNA(Pro) deacylase
MITYQPKEIARGDVIEVDGRHVGDAPRLGEILEVLGTPERPHYRVRWDDDHESVFYPGGGTRIRRSAKTTPATEQLVELLREADIEFEFLPHRRTQTARSEARALGVLPQETAKTVIASVDGGYVRAVVPASRRLDTDKVAAAVGARAITLLTEGELGNAYPQFELGAVPPFGGRDGDRVVVDSSLAEGEYVVLEAGVHDTSLRVRASDLIHVAGAQVADIATG